MKNSATPFIIIGDSITKGLRRYQNIWKKYFKDAFNLGISGDQVMSFKMSCGEPRYFFATHNFVCDYTLRHKYCGPKSTGRYCRWSHQIYWNLYEESSENNYHHYWHATKAEDIVLWPLLECISWGRWYFYPQFCRAVVGNLKL